MASDESRSSEEGGPERTRKPISALIFAAGLVCFALPMAAIFPSCSKQRVATVSGYEMLAPHSYDLPAESGRPAQHVETKPDLFGYAVLLAVVAGVGLSLLGGRTLWLMLVGAAGAVTLVIMEATAGAGQNSSAQAEPGFWIMAGVFAAAPAGEVRLWWRALLVALGTVASAAAVIAIVLLVVSILKR